jgi:hypothetical protein
VKRILVVLLVAAAALPAASGAAATRSCTAPSGDGNGRIERLRATGTTCHAARLVARSWLKASGPDGKCDTRAEDCMVFGYRCASTDQGFADSRVTCTRTGRRIMFISTV